MEEFHAHKCLLPDTEDIYEHGIRDGRHPETDASADAKEEDTLTEERSRCEGTTNS